MTSGSLALLLVASFGAGAINSVAGGGSLLSFPAAIAAGMPPIVANATNAVAMSPGSFFAALAYRSELEQEKTSLRRFAPPALAGGVLGAMLLLWTPQSMFDAIVPLLVAFAALLLVVQNLRRAPQGSRSMATPVAVVLQLLVAVYGGYFGAGMGIMMLALYAALGATDIHRMNALKALIGGLINLVASIAFVVAGTVRWGPAAMMTVAASAGGFAGAAVARRISPAVVRWGVAAYGVALAGVLAWKQWR